MTAAELMRDIKSNIEPQYNDIMHKMDLLLDSIEDFEDLNERYEEFRNHGGAPTESENLQNYISNLESMINVIDNQIRRLDNDVYAGTRTAPARSIDRTLPEKNRTVLY